MIVLPLRFLGMFALCSTGTGRILLYHRYFFIPYLYKYIISIVVLVVAFFTLRLFCLIESPTFFVRLFVRFVVPRRRHHSPRRRNVAGFPCPQTFPIHPAARHRRAASLTSDRVPSAARDARSDGGSRRGSAARSAEMQELALEALHRPPLRRRCVVCLILLSTSVVCLSWPVVVCQIVDMDVFFFFFLFFVCRCCCCVVMCYHRYYAVFCP